MGGSNSEAEEAEEHSSSNSNIPRLPLFNFNTATTLLLHSPEPSGMRTPPLQTSASVPFGWEEQPGKPRPCTSLVPFSSPKSLELPPRLLLEEVPSFTHYHSPVTSFRMSAEEEEEEEERGQLGTLTLGNKEKQGRFVITTWMKKKIFKVKRETSGSSHVFPSSTDNNNKDTDDSVVGNSHNKLRILKKMKLSAGNFTNPLFHGKSHVWTKICEGLKQAVPWKKSKKLKKYGCGWH